MTDRLAWQRGAQPLTYVAYPTGNPAEITARLFYAPYYDGHARKWQVEIVAGRSRFARVGDSKQFVADLANAVWREVLAGEVAAVAAIEDLDDMRVMIQAARFTEGLNIEAFGLEQSSVDRLYALENLLRAYANGHAVRPLYLAVQAQLSLRRDRGEQPRQGVYGTTRVTEETRRWPPLALLPLYHQ